MYTGVRFGSATKSVILATHATHRLTSFPCFTVRNVSDTRRDRRIRDVAL